MARVWIAINPHHVQLVGGGSSGIFGDRPSTPISSNSVNGERASLSSKTGWGVAADKMGMAMDARDVRSKRGAFF